MGTYLLTGFFKEINHSPYRQIVKKVCRMLTINYVFCVSTVFDLACDVFSGLCDALCPGCNFLALLQVSLIIMKQGPFQKY